MNSLPEIEKSGNEGIMIPILLAVLLQAAF